MVKVDPVLQANLGAKNDGDCTLASITAVVNYYLNNPTIAKETIYKKVRKSAEKRFFSPKSGTLPIFNKAILKEVLKSYDINKKVKTKYFKDCGWGIGLIEHLVMTETPVILSLNNDGLGYYKNHTVTIVDVKDRQLVVLDNWTRTPSYIDYDKLSMISCITYAE